MPLGCCYAGLLHPSAKSDLMGNFNQHTPQGDDLSLPKRPLTPLERGLVESVKDAFVTWAVDRGIPCAEGASLFDLRLKNPPGGAARVAQEIGPAIQDFLFSEIQLEALWRKEHEEVGEVAQRVRDKIDHEFRIVKNGFVIGKRIAKALASPDPETRRRQLAALNRRSLEFALGEEPNAVALEALRPILVAAKALGMPDVEKQIEPALSEYRTKTSFQAPVFMRALQTVASDPALSDQALAGLPKDAANDLVCSATRAQYPSQEEYQRLRESCSAAALNFLESVMEIFEGSSNAFATSVARLYRLSEVIVPEADTPGSTINRELVIVYGQPGEQKNNERQ